jgi:hypothetical protein
MRSCVYVCDYDIDIHVRPPTLLILAARENRVNDIPTVLYTYILWWCVYSCIIMHTYTHTHGYYIYLYTYVLKRDTRPEQAFSPEAMRTHTHTPKHLIVFIYIYY